MSVLQISWVKKVFFFYKMAIRIYMSSAYSAEEQTIRSISTKFTTINALIICEECCEDRYVVKNCLVQWSKKIHYTHTVHERAFWTNFKMYHLFGQKCSNNFICISFKSSSYLFWYYSAPRMVLMEFFSKNIIVWILYL